ncbi:MAG: hypothetical protein IPK22_04825 [Verrucomicrobiaceae bacterium]|nr:hypothetical protein [Verrucomicrobiaceae bacterium]
MLNPKNFIRCEATFGNAWKSTFNELEVCVIGDEISPSQTAIALVQQLGLHMEAARTKALQLLKLLVRLDDQWSFDGIEIGPESLTDKTVDLQLSHVDDLYGLWVVTFSLNSGSPEPVAFRREQI